MFPEEYQEPTYGTAIQVVMMLRMLDDAAGGALPIRELAERLEVHPRTVKRYIDAIGAVVPGSEGQPLIERRRCGRTPYAVLNRPNGGRAAAGAGEAGERRDGADGVTPPVAAVVPAARGDADGVDLVVAVEPHVVSAPETAGRLPGAGWLPVSDGRLRGTVRVRVDGSLLGWLAAWGPSIEVLEPEDVRDELRDFLAEALERYL